jgi:hypothetical protein
VLRWPIHGRFLRSLGFSFIEIVKSGGKTSHEERVFVLRGIGSKKKVNLAYPTPLQGDVTYFV